MKRLLAVVATLALVTAVSSAQLALKGVGGAIGFVTASLNTGGSSSESMSGFAIAAHADFGEFTKDIAFVPDVMYWSMSKDISGVTAKFSDFAINANAHYNVEMEGMLKPYVGAGLGINFVSSTVTVPSFFGFGGGTATSSDTKIGINLLAGVNYKLNDMLTLVVEPRYVLSSDFNHFLIKAGVTYALK